MEHEHHDFGDLALYASASNIYCKFICTKQSLGHAQQALCTMNAAILSATKDAWTIWSWSINPLHVACQFSCINVCSQSCFECLQDGQPACHDQAQHHTARPWQGNPDEQEHLLLISTCTSAPWHHMADICLVACHCLARRGMLAEVITSSDLS